MAPILLPLHTTSQGEEWGTGPREWPCAGVGPHAVAGGPKALTDPAEA